MSGVMLSITGTSEAMSGINRLVVRAQAATRQGVADGLAVVQRQAKINASGRPGPMVRSGALRAGIVVDGPRSLGLGLWEGSCGPTSRYGRAIELGHPHWKRGVKYPYLGPAFLFAQRVGIPAAMHRAWVQAVTV